MTIKEKLKMNTAMALAYHDFDKGLNRHSFFKVNNRQLSEDLVQDTIYENSEIPHKWRKN